MHKIEELRIAIENNDVADAERLLSEADQLANCRDKTPPALHFAVWCDRPEIIAVLLDHGADIEMKDQDRSTTPVRYAIVYDRTEVIRLLVDRGANTGAIVDNGTTAMQMAKDAAAGSLEEFEELPTREQYSEIVDLLTITISSCCSVDRPSENIPLFVTGTWASLSRKPSLTATCKS